MTLDTQSFLLQRIAKNALSLGMLGIVFFVLAGRIDVLGFWLYIATALVYQIISLLIILPHHPEYMTLAEMRKAKHTNVKKWDKILVLAMAGGTYLMVILAALDLGHFHISPLALGFAVPGIILYIVGSALNHWAMLHNPHFERGVRIQSERDHQVASTGPYQYIRHPGYLGSLLFYVAFPLIVGAAIAWIGAVFGILGFIIRTHLEDRTLREELDGYATYAQTVKYRLIPYVW